MSGSDFGPMLSVAFYLFLLYFFGKLFQFLSVPVILAEIAVGIVLGPKLLDAVPYASDGTCSEFPSSCNLATWNGDRQVSIWQFIGNIGVTLMIMESGMHINFKEVRNVGGQALAVAIVGTLLPVGLGILFVGFLCDGAYYPDGFAAGVALAPTSVGIAIQMLTENKMLSSTPGQTILTAAFIDDILSLVLLVIMLTLASGDPQAHTIVLPLVDAFAFVGMGVGLANYVFIYLKPLLDRHIKDYPKFSFQPRDEIHLMLMLACLVLFGWIGSLIGSHLLGAFVAGVCFVNVPRSHLVWKRQLKRIIKWCMRIFFGASVAFSIPVIEMISPDAIWKGAVVGLVPCILAKILAGCMYRPTQPGTKIYSKGEVVARRPKNKKKYKKIPKHICCSRLGDGLSRVMSIESMMVGFAMVGRGEFAYLVAEISKSTTYGASRKKMLSESIYAVVLWALIWSTIFAPIAFKWALQIYSSGKVMVRSQSIGGMSKKYSNQPFKIRLVSEHHVGILYEVLGVLHDSGLDVLEATAESDEVHDVDVFLVQPRSGTANFDDDKLEEISHHLKDAMGDKSGNARIVFEPAEIESDYKNDCMLEIELIGDHHPDLLHEILDWLALPENNLNVMKAFAETRTQHVDGHSLQIDIDKFFASPTNGIPITSLQRKNVREALEHILQVQHSHGEVMVRLRHANEAQILHPIPKFTHNEKVVVVVLNGPHHNDLLHEICDLFFEIHMDVLQAEFDHEGNQDKHVFYLQHIDHKKDIGRHERHVLRARIATLYKSHFDSTDEILEMSVRPMKLQHRHTTDNGSTRSGGPSSSLLSSDSGIKNDTDHEMEYGKDNDDESRHENQHSRFYRFSMSEGKDTYDTNTENTAIGERKSENKTSSASLSPTLPPSSPVHRGQHGVAMARSDLKLMINAKTSPSIGSESPIVSTLSLTSSSTTSPSRRTNVEGLLIPVGASLKIADLPQIELGKSNYYAPTLKLISGRGRISQRLSKNYHNEGEIEVVDINLAIAPSDVSCSPSSSSFVSLADNNNNNNTVADKDNLDVILADRKLSIHAIDDADMDYEDSDDEEANKLHDIKKSSNMCWFVVVISIFLVIADIVFAYTLLAPKNVHHTNTTCVHHCADQCVSTCDAEEIHHSGKNYSSGTDHRFL